MTTTTSYGTWANATRMFRVEDSITEALTHWVGGFNVDKIADEYRAAINAALPEGVSLAGNDFYGPAPLVDAEAWEEAREEIVEAISAVDLFAIAARHEYTAPGRADN